MSLRETFAKARSEGRAALIGYLPAGFPGVEESIDLMRAMVEGGCDIIEVGLPYSDPVMDGPTIQAAAQQALEHGTRTADLFRVVAGVAATGADVVVMTYWNPVERYGVERFAADLAAAGGQGMITPDMTPDEAGEWLAASEKHGLDRIFLVAPSSTGARLAMTVEHCSGFVYATAVMGVTGARERTSDLASPLVARTREVTDLPVCVGLGVSTGDQAAEVASFADGVIVGSAFVKQVLGAQGPDAVDAVEAVRSLARELAEGVRRA